MARRPVAPALLVAVLGLAACAAPVSPGGGGDALARALVGAWCNSNDGGATCWAYDEFKTDGSFQACGRTEDDARPFRGSGRFSVSGQRMCYVVAEASPNFWLPPGGRYCTDIIAIDARTHRYRDIDTGAVFHLRRVPTAEVRCPE